MDTSSRVRLARADAILGPGDRSGSFKEWKHVYLSLHLLGHLSFDIGDLKEILLTG